MRAARYLFFLGRAAEGHDGKKRHEEHQDARGAHPTHGSECSWKAFVTCDTAIQRLTVTDAAPCLSYGTASQTRPEIGAGQGNARERVHVWETNIWLLF